MTSTNTRLLTLSGALSLALALAGCGGASQRASGGGTSDFEYVDRAAIARMHGGTTRAVGQPWLRAVKAEDEAWPEPDGHEATVYYQVAGRFREGRFSPQRVVVHPAVAPELLSSTGPGRCNEVGANGFGEVSDGGPAELAFWFAITDLFRQQTAQRDRAGPGTRLHVARSETTEANVDLQEFHRQNVARNVTEFEVAPGLVCASQFKRFMLDEDDYVSPAELAERAAAKDLRKHGLKVPDRRMGMDQRISGQLLWELVGRKSQGRALYELRVHMANDAETRVGREGEIIDSALICRSDSPILARRLKTYRRTVVRTSDHHTQACVWPNG
jgi:hypothetical protein